MKLRLLCPLTIACSLAGLVSVVCAAEVPGRPNFLVMIADDLTWHDLGYEGATK
jgi:hypothetical protein